MCVFKAGRALGFHLQIADKMSVDSSNGDCRTHEPTGCRGRLGFVECENGEAVMTRKEIRVGIVGANAQKSWAKVSHVPGINGQSCSTTLSRELWTSIMRSLRRLVR